MRIIIAAIIDADLISCNKHRFPNLACMKLSSYFKSIGYQTVLKTDYNNLESYDIVTISKVFMDTELPDEPSDKTLKTESTIHKYYENHPILNLPNVIYGGTGFYYDNAPALESEIEHIMPDYHLYDDWIKASLETAQLTAKKKKKPFNQKKYMDSFKYYTEYSIGFLTRGCFRGCEFCVNKNYKSVQSHSPVYEFLDRSRPKLCLLDDNFLGLPGWKKQLLEIQNLGIPFQFRQGLDERLLTDEKCEILFKSKYDGDFIFAFDNINDTKLIEEKAYMIRRHYKNKGQNIKFYVLCGFDRCGKYDRRFWIQDIKDIFKRIYLLSKYNFKPYIMRYKNYTDSEFFGSYINIACWCNQPSFFYNLSYYDFCKKDDIRKSDGRGTSATWRYYQLLLDEAPELNDYFTVEPKTLRLDYSEW